MVTTIDNEPAVKVPERFGPIGLDGRIGERQGGPDFYLKRSTLEKMLDTLDEMVQPGTLVVKTFTKRPGPYKVVRRVLRDGTLMVVGSTSPTDPVGDTSNSPAADRLGGLIDDGVFTIIYEPGVTEADMPAGTCWRQTALGAEGGAWSAVDRVRWNGLRMEVVDRGCVVLNSGRSLSDAIESEALGYWERVPDAPKTPTYGPGDDVVVGYSHNVYRVILPATFSSDGSIGEAQYVNIIEGSAVDFPADAGFFHRSYTIHGFTKDLYPTALKAGEHPVIPWPSDLKSLVGTEITYTPEGGPTKTDTVIGAAIRLGKSLRLAGPDFHSLLVSVCTLHNVRSLTPTQFWDAACKSA